MAQNILSKIYHKIISHFNQYLNIFKRLLVQQGTFAQKFKGLLEESFKTKVTSDNSFAPKLDFIHKARIGANFKVNCLMKDNVSFTYKYVVNLSIVVYEVDSWSRDLNSDFTLVDCLFGAVKVQKIDQITLE